MFYPRLDFITFSACLFLLGAPSAYGWFEHDRAISAGQRHEWDKACQLLETVAVHNPDKCEIMYDAGVAAYKAGNFEHAQNYFNAATTCASTNTQDQAEAFFNMGNSYAQATKLQDAVNAYEKALTLEPNNKKTQENLALVKKLLEQQKKDEKNKNDSKKNDQDKKDDEQKQQQDTQEQDSQNGDGDAGQQGQQAEGNKDQQKNDQQKPGNDGDKKNDKKSSQSAKNEENSDARNDQKNQDAGKKEDAADKPESGHNDGPQLDPRLAELLKEREKKDAQGNKQMIKSTVGKHMVSNHGQNCW